MSEPINTIADDDGVSETRQRILDATLKVFIDKGYKGATTRRIAQEADVNEVTIFRHFGNKLKLIAAVLEQASGTSDFEQVIENQLSGDIRSDFEHLIKHLALGRRKNWETMRLFMCEVHNIPELHEIMHQKMEEREQVFVDYFQQQIDAGVLRADLNPQLMLHVFRGAIFAYGRHIREGDDSDNDNSLDQQFGQLTDILLMGSLNQSK